MYWRRKYVERALKIDDEISTLLAGRGSNITMIVLQTPATNHYFVFILTSEVYFLIDIGSHKNLLKDYWPTFSIEHFELQKVLTKIKSCLIVVGMSHYFSCHKGPERGVSARTS